MWRHDFSVPVIVDQNGAGHRICFNAVAFVGVADCRAGKPAGAAANPSTLHSRCIVETSSMVRFAWHMHGGWQLVGFAVE